jgi:uncharacterized protein YihD (DUF1040 family)
MVTQPPKHLLHVLQQVYVQLAQVVAMVMEFARLTQQNNGVYVVYLKNADQDWVAPCLATLGIPVPQLQLIQVVVKMALMTFFSLRVEDVIKEILVMQRLAQRDDFSNVLEMPITMTQLELYKIPFQQFSIGKLIYSLEV